MQTQQPHQPRAVISFKGSHVNPLISLFDCVTRIEQRELKPSYEEQRLMTRCKVVKALLNYMDRQVEQLAYTRIYAHASIIALKRFEPTTSSENVIGQLRQRIYQIHMLKKSGLH